MADKYLIVVDMQNDFVDGSLGTAEAQNITGDVIQKVREFDGEVIFTLDTHFDDYLQTSEGKMLPIKHCIKGSNGFKLIPELEKLKNEINAQAFEKNTFASVELVKYLKSKYENGELASIELIGLCTDICVVSNALLIKAYMPEAQISVDASCCAGVTPSKHKAALDTMESCQIIINNR